MQVAAADPLLTWLCISGGSLMMAVLLLRRRHRRRVGWGVMPMRPPLFSGWLARPD
ncbi:MAG: hypothetical protein ACOYLS_10185 [Polymorphobacter sp.]